MKTHAITTTTGFQLSRHRIEFTIEPQEERRNFRKNSHEMKCRLSSVEHGFNVMVRLVATKRNDSQTIEQDREEGAKLFIFLLNCVVCETTRGHTIRSYNQRYGWFAHSYSPTNGSEHACGPLYIAFH